MRETAEEVRALGRRVRQRPRRRLRQGARARFADDVFADTATSTLVNNAGVTITADFEEHSLEDWEWIVGINFWGVVYGCKFFLPYLKQAEEAHIVNVSSMFGIVGVPGQSSYCATKFAVRGLSEALWVELKEHNIGVTSIHPGGVRTNIAKDARTKEEGKKSEAIKIIERYSVPPERCAELIVDAIKKNKMRQLVARESVPDRLRQAHGPGAAAARDAERPQARRGSAASRAAPGLTALPRWPSWRPTSVDPAPDPSTEPEHGRESRRQDSQIQSRGEPGPEPGHQLALQQQGDLPARAGVERLRRARQAALRARIDEARAVPEGRHAARSA